MEYQNELDAAIISLTFYDILNAQLLMQTMTRAVDSLMLDTELTREQKNVLKRDAGFTSKAIYFLSQAGDAYRRCLKALDQLGAELDTYVNPKTYDLAMASANTLTAISLLYMHKTDNDPETETKIHKFLLDVGKPTAPEFVQVYRSLMIRARKMEANHTQNDKDNGSNEEGADNR